ncbi:unnamed protein product [Linum trigynum]|uniref:Uncharacterized protein n=1 Tax=Linum trigynum TaxID=586398 RepID=A0AAV2FSB2_9ROSI
MDLPPTEQAVGPDPPSKPIPVEPDHPTGDAPNNLAPATAPTSDFENSSGAPLNIIIVRDGGTPSLLPTPLTMRFPQAAPFAGSPTTPSLPKKLASMTLVPSLLVTPPIR